MKKYSPIIWGVMSLLLFVGCNLFEDSYHPRTISAYPSASESGIQWDGDRAKVTANIISVDVKCIPVKKERRGIFEEKIRTEYEIAATAHIRYRIIDKGFFEEGTAFPNFKANVIFEAVTASGVRLALTSGRVRFNKNGNSTKTSVKISGLSIEEIKRVVGVQARWEYGRY